MAQAKEEITAEYFEKCTGYKPHEKQLDFCNCSLAGEPGHVKCGWNYRVNKPMFENSEE